MKKELNTCNEDHESIWFKEDDCPVCRMRNKIGYLVEQIEELNDEVHYYKVKTAKLREKLWNPHCLFIEGKTKT